MLVTWKRNRGEIMAIVKAAKVKLTAGRISDFRCPPDKPQAFLWSDEPLGLAVRATVKGSKSYIYQTKVMSKSARFTIGDVSVWSISSAQTEARRLQTVIDQGNDPRQLKADELATKEAGRLVRDAELAAYAQIQIAESVTLSFTWDEYMKERKPHWGERHYQDHEDVISAGGEKSKRSKRLTQPGVLASLSHVRLVDLTPDRVTTWAKTEGEKRAGRARLATRLLKAFLNWCAEHPTYSTIVTSNAAKNKKAREQLGKPKTLDDALQKEQLKAWFAAVKNIGNPVISAYLQSLLLTGARPSGLASVEWADIDFQWKHWKIRDKVEGERIIPLTPYLEHLLSSLPRRNQYVFSSPIKGRDYLSNPQDAFKDACKVAGIELTMYGLRRSFATLSEWIEMPAGIAAQIQGHKPSGVREKHYIRRPLDLLRMWHVKIEAWILNEAGIKFVPVKAGLRAVA
jgi:integrase